MFEHLYEQLDSLLSRHGMIINVLLKSERSLIEDDEQLQMELIFAASEEESLPLASIHLFPLAEDICEIEVEITFDQLGGQAKETASLWLQAKSIVAEISLSEKKRFLSAEQLAEHQLVLDYHFVLPLPKSGQETAPYLDTLARFAADLGRLVRL